MQFFALEDYVLFGGSFTVLLQVLNVGVKTCSKPLVPFYGIFWGDSFSDDSRILFYFFMILISVLFAVPLAVSQHVFSFSLFHFLCHSDYSPCSCSGGGIGRRGGGIFWGVEGAGEPLRYHWGYHWGV